MNVWDPYNARRYCFFKFELRVFIKLVSFQWKPIYSTSDISATYLTEEEIVIFERPSCQPVSDKNLPDSEGKSLHQYFCLNSRWVYFKLDVLKKCLLSGKRKSESKSNKMHRETEEEILQDNALFLSLMKTARTLQNFIHVHLGNLQADLKNFISGSAQHPKQRCRSPDLFERCTTSITFLGAGA